MVSISEVSSVNSTAVSSRSAATNGSSSDIEISFDNFYQPDTKTLKKQAEAKKHFDIDKDSGRLVFVKTLFGKGYYNYTVRIQESGLKEPLGAIKKRFNLPDGSFANLVESGNVDTTLSNDPSNKDQGIPIPKIIRIYKSDMDKGTGQD